MRHFLFAALLIASLALGATDGARADEPSLAFPSNLTTIDGTLLASSLGLRLSAQEIAPAILMLNNDLSIGWMQQGRNAVYYGDCELMKEIAYWEKIPI